MAKTEINKSALIREALKATPDKPAAEIAKELGVNPALVYNVRASVAKKAGAVGATTGKKRRTKSRRKAAPKPAVKMAAPEGAHAALDSAFEFVMKVGGLVHAEKLIDKLKALKERL